MLLILNIFFAKDDFAGWLKLKWLKKEPFALPLPRTPWVQPPDRVNESTSRGGLRKATEEILLHRPKIPFSSPLHRVSFSFSFHSNFYFFIILF